MFRSAPKKGKLIPYFDKTFFVYPTVFQPFDDSAPLIKNLKISAHEKVLDVCTGSGIIAIFAALKGAKEVLAVDINPIAIKSARKNAKRFKVNKKVKFRVSNMFSAIKENEKFDVITGNLPFMNKKARDCVEATQWDTNLHCHKELFKHAKKHLNKNGRMYLAQASFGAVKEMQKLAKKAGFKVKLLAKKKSSLYRKEYFYGFLLTLN